MLSSSSVVLVLVVVAIIASYVSVEAYSVRSIARSATRSLQMSTKKTSNQDERVFRVEIPLGEGYQSVITNFRPIFAKSTIFVTTYDIPFSLNVEKAPPGITLSSFDIQETDIYQLILVFTKITCADSVLSVYGDERHITITFLLH